MSRLSALDSSFLYMETPDTPMHVAGLAIFAPTGEDSQVLFSRFRDHIAARLHLLPFFRRRLNALPATIDNPVWVADQNVDLNWHLRQIALPRPGTAEQLHTLVSRLHMILLDRDKPLWQFYMIEGLKDGGFAIYTKMHHAGIDGGAGVAALDIIFSATPDSPPVAPGPKPTPQREPNILELISTAYADFYRQQLGMMQAWPSMGKAAAAVWRRTVEDLSRRKLAAQPAPKTIFNVTVSNQRSFGTSSISLTETKAVAKATKSKVNDVVMAICAGALRRYLKPRGALPDQPLIAAIPVSLREAGNTEMNNQVTTMICSLATDVADPVERIAAIVASSQDSKARLGDVREALPKDIALFGAPLVMTGIAQWAARTKMADQLPAVMNVLISNVAGPKRPMYCAGARCTGYFPVSIPANGSALNMTVHSYLDNLDFGIIACRQAVPDTQKIADYLVQEFEALKRMTLDKAPAAEVRTIDVRPKAAAKQAS
ncbi:MAG TPA: wax ester/triacylglycerol synthase family O-acyltransferase [Vineibacter sp.]|nr:wax ester/triacylglycerol synthase family O-acyltransferase [Vineibacter sp.]